MAESSSANVWPVRCARPEESDAVLAVRNLAYSPDAALRQDFWDWRYFRNPHWRTQILVAESADQIIGLQPIASFPALVMGEVAAVCMLTGVVTHPEFRRRGVFTSLITQAFAQIRQQGDWLAYTFPNKLSYPGFMRTGQWLHIGSLPLYLKPLDWPAVIGSRVGNRGAQKVLSHIGRIGFRLVDRSRSPTTDQITICEIRAWDERADDFWQCMTDCYRAHIVVRRDREYLTWRYVERPDEQYTIFQAEQHGTVQGYIVVKLADLFDLRAGLIIDIQALSAEVCEQLIAQALAYFKQVSVEVAGAVQTDVLFYPSSFARNGFVRCPIRLCPKEFYFVGQVITPSAAPAVDFKNWFLTWGDSDIV